MEIVRWEHFDFGGSSARTNTTSHIVTRFVETFLRAFDWSAIDIVLVESQARSTAKIRSLAFAMQAFFDTLRLANSGTALVTEGNSTRCHYEFVWSVGSCKLSVLDTFTRLKPKGRARYVANKRLAVEHVTILLDEVESLRPWEPFFHGLRKKDDAADALLQALAYLKKKGHFVQTGADDPCEIDD